MRKLLLAGIFCLQLFVSNATAQQQPIGQWRSYMPYNTAVSVASDESTIYVATQYSLYTFNRATEEIEKYSKVNGMSDVGMSKIAYDNSADALVLAYTNSNIDILKDNNFYNIPDIKIKSFSGSKAINNIITEKGLAYLSTDVGIVVLDLERVEVKETYTFISNSENIPVKELTFDDTYFYAATPKGMYRASKNSIRLQDFSEWTLIGGEHNFISVTVSDNNVYVTQVDSLFKLANNNLEYILSTDSSTRSVMDGITGYWLIENYDGAFTGKATRYNNQVADDSFRVGGFFSEFIDMDNELETKWIPDEFNGLKIRTLRGDPYNGPIPDGPGGIGNFEISVSGNNIAIAHGGYDDKYNPSGNKDGFSTYINNEWENYQSFSYTPFGDSMNNFTNILIRPDNTVYAGSTTDGLFVLEADGTYKIYKQNSFIDPSTTGSDFYRVSGLAFDNDGVLWLTVLGGSPTELAAITPDGETYNYIVAISRSGIPNGAAHLTVDDLNQKWYAAPGSGVIVYDDKHTPENPLDDDYIQLRAGEGAGGLPDNEVYSIVTDKDGSVWIGTKNGIGIVSCPGQVLQRQCEAEKRIVQFDQFAGFLFQNEQVRTIAVDGANRKWIGTNNGVWLISENGDEIIERFTKDNSPLPSDIIQDITIEGSTGEVYIGTELGMVSYRGTAIDGGAENSELITFPNPVPTAYNGQIAIKGFVENADVRITDVSGQLVYRTTALGGQVVWNGKDYNGRRPQSGVYLIFATNRDGSQTTTGKLVFME